MSAPLSVDLDRRAQVPKLALTIEESCDALGVSWDLWKAHIAPDVRIARVGRRQIVPVSELQRWLDAHAETVLPQPRGQKR